MKSLHDEIAAREKQIERLQVEIDALRIALGVLGLAEHPRTLLSEPTAKVVEKAKKKTAQRTGLPSLPPTLRESILLRALASGNHEVRSSDFAVSGRILHAAHQMLSRMSRVGQLHRLEPGVYRLTEIGEEMAKRVQRRQTRK